jgi:phosphoglycolate phosphatase-like HAD superfamily hydrolase
LVKEYKILFWDFDGVIKESISAKADAFERLFACFGSTVANRVRQHHEAHGGLSRYEKIPLYLRWAGEPVTEAKVDEFCRRFSEHALQAVIDSPWVPGVREYIDTQWQRQRFVLLTATPCEEMMQVLRAVSLLEHFREVHGAPTAKAAAIADVLERWGCAPADALVIGDSDTDLDAAEANCVPFLLRRTAYNSGLQRRFCGPTFDNLTTIF